MNILLKNNLGKIQSSFSLIVKIFVIASIFHSTYYHLWSILFADILLLFLLFMPLILRKNYSINIPKEFEIILLFFILIVFFFGDQRGFIIQAFFGVFIGFISFAIMLITFSNSKLKPNYFMIILFSFSVALALGLIAEMLKFYLKILMDYTIIDSEYSYLIRGLSLVALGAFISSLIGFIYMKGFRTKAMINLVSRFKNKNPNFFLERTYSPEEIIKLIKKGEHEKLEFKSTLRLNLHTNEHDRKIEDSALKTIVAFLNSEGGVLLIGVNDKGEIIGTQKDGFIDNDKYNRHFTNLIRERVGNEFLPYMNFELIFLEEKYIMKIECITSEKPVFLKSAGTEDFYIRVGASSLLLTGLKLVEYIKHKFKN